jgi:hypothetical protein
VLAATAAGAAGPVLPWPNATEAEVYAAIERVDTHAELAALQRLTQERNDAALLARMRQVAGRTDWPPAAREYVLFSYAQSLSDLPPAAVGTDVIEWLGTRRPEIRVPHPDDDRLGIALFNIPAAAAGAVTEWRRSEGAARAHRLLDRGPDAWVDGWLAAGQPEREGAMLDRIGDDELRALADTAERRTDTDGALAEVTAWAAIRLHDPERLAQALARPGVPQLAALARTAGAAFDAALARRTLGRMLETAPPQNSAALLAGIAPRLLESAAGTEDLFGLLDHETLGGAAALALARSADGAIRSRLETIAGQAQGLASQRAASALASVGEGDFR